MKRSIAILLLVASGAVAQATFEAPAVACALANYPVPCAALGGPEGISGNGLALSTVDTANGAGFPTEAAQYLRVVASGPGVYGGVANEMYIPIPLGAVAVTFQWDFYDAEGGGSGFNDGMSVDVIGVCGGPSLANLVLIDDNTFIGGGGFDGGACGSFAQDQAPAGANAVNAAVLPAGGIFLRVAVWNGTDDAVASHGVIDNVCFVGCVPFVPPCILLFSSPLGAGSLQIDNTTCVGSAGLDYQIGVTFAAGAFPNGWFFGLDIGFNDIIGQHSVAFQNILWGSLSGAGASTFGPVGGLPSGLQIWAVTAEFNPGFGLSTGSRAPVTYTIP